MSMEMASQISSSALQETTKLLWSSGVRPIIPTEINLSTLVAINDDEGPRGVVFNGVTFNALLKVSGGADLNNDGLADLLMSAPTAPSGLLLGQSYVIFGRTDGFPHTGNLAELLSVNGGDGTQGFVLNGVAGGDLSGASLAGANDINGDGFADLLIGAFAADSNGNFDSGQTYVVFGRQTDSTPPTITPIIAGTLGNNGWYTSDVSLTWDVVDDESSIASSIGCDLVTVTVDTMGDTFTCEASSGGGTSSESLTIMKDIRAPILSLVEPAHGASYALGQSVLASWTASDATSGLIQPVEATAPSGSLLDTAMLGTKTFMVRATDSAGHVAAATHTYEVIDPTPQVVTPNISGTLGSNGWYVSDVTVSWTVGDPQSAILSSTGCDPVILSVDTAWQTFTCSATSDGGTTMESVTIQRDATVPFVSLVSPPNGATYVLLQVITADWVVTDGVSGIGSVSAIAPNGGLIDTTTAGTNAFTVSATDVAGNTTTVTHTYTVLTASEGIDALILQVQSLSLPKGLENSLVKKLQNANKDLSKGNVAGALEKLQLFVDEMNAQKGKKIDPSAADTLIAQAQLIIAALSAS